jgi:hypothetical protein
VSEPIIIIGAPRSGTTLLADLIEAHPDVTVVREPRLVWRYGNDDRSDELRAEHATPKVIDHIDANFAAALAAGGTSRLAEKTPANALRPRFVDAVFPDALYVHITRNGWGAVPSLRSFWQNRGAGLDRKQLRKVRRRLREASPAQLRHYASELLRRARGGRGRRAPLYGPRLAGLQQIVDELGHLEAAAIQWRTCVEQTASFGRGLPEDRYRELQLENLDALAVAGMLDFCGLCPSPEVAERFTALYDADTARRRAGLDDDERARIGPYVEPMNSWLGYTEAAGAGPGSEVRS